MYQKRREDPLTGEKFVPKRYNQKFANRENQIAYNNIKARQKRHAKLGTDRILDKNREILKRLLGELESCTKNRDFLLGAGFNFKFFSGIYERKGITIFAVYEFQIMRNGNNEYEITKA